MCVSLMLSQHLIHWGQSRCQVTVGHCFAGQCVRTVSTGTGTDSVCRGTNPSKNPQGHQLKGIALRRNPSPYLCMTTIRKGQKSSTLWGRQACYQWLPGVTGVDFAAAIYYVSRHSGPGQHSSTARLAPVIRAQFHQGCLSQKAIHGAAQPC